MDACSYQKSTNPLSHRFCVQKLQHADGAFGSSIPNAQERTSSSQLLPPQSHICQLTQAGVFALKQRRRPRSLLSMCLSILGSHLEDVWNEMNLLGQILPASVKISLLAIAHRRGLLNDELLSTLADESWEIIDVSGSDVTDIGIHNVAQTCYLLKAVDISRCSRITAASIRTLVQYCPFLNTLRCGGTALSNAAAAKSLGYLLPGLNLENEAEENWEDLDMKQVGRGAQALRWIVWPSIDSKSLERLALECPRVVINPSLSLQSPKISTLPQYALSNIVLDDIFVEDIDPETWATKSSLKKISSLGNEFGELSIAERFKLAFTERDERMAAKRAKNMRQNQRRAEKAWLNSDLVAKAVFLAGKTHKASRN
eukprot:c25611_g1_i1 orf=139-1251(+)